MSTMQGSEDSNRDAQPMVRFAGEWVPAHTVWRKMETATVVLEAIDRFNTHFPELASADTREVVPLVRQRLREIELRMPGRQHAADLGGIAAELLAAMSPEQVVDTLAERHRMRIGLAQLVQLAGAEAYLQALGREAIEFRHNKISPQQTAQLWNDAARPVLGGGPWTAPKVEELIAGHA